MSGLLEKHLAAITGAGSGIGRAIALGYAKAGAGVVALDANAETAQATASAIKSDGGSAWSYELDVRDSEACRHLAATVNASVGQLSVLVNNAASTAAMPSPPSRRPWSRTGTTSWPSTFMACSM